MPFEARKSGVGAAYYSYIGYIATFIQDTIYMSKARFLLLIGVLASLSSMTRAMVFDNRYFPLLKKPYIFVQGRPSHADGNVFFMTASQAIDDLENEIGIPEIHGKLDLLQLSNAINELKLPNPLRSELRLFSFPYSVGGVIQAQGISFSYEHSFCDLHPSLALGINWFFMNAYSRQEFLLDPSIAASTLAKTSAAELDDARRQMFTELGLVNANSRQFGVSDLDVYMRLWHEWEYTLKFRRIVAALNVGLLAPTGVQMKNDSPASLPFGGSGHWGMYAQAESEFEVKEDMSVGVMLRVNKRFARTKNLRMPIQGEPRIFGAIVGAARVTPGATLIFSPYGVVENLRAGLGVRVFYTLTKHFEDTWCDARADQTIPVKLAEVENFSTWKSDYVTVQVFYDFGKVKTCRGLDPIVKFTWDIPALFFASDRAATTHRISLGVEFNF